MRVVELVRKLWWLCRVMVFLFLGLVVLVGVVYEVW